MIIELSKCVVRRAYTLHSRNLSIGVFNGSTGFIGIREKFGDRFLDIEVYGHTAFPLKELDHEVEEGVVLDTYLGSVDDETQRPVEFDRPVDQGGRGWYFVDTGESSLEIMASAVPNKPLFEFLDRITLTFGRTA